MQKTGPGLTKIGDVKDRKTVKDRRRYGAALCSNHEAKRMSEYVCEADPSTSSYSIYSEPSGLKKHLQEKPMVTERLRNDPSHRQNDALGLA